MARPWAALLASCLLGPGGAQLLHHSSSPYGPWEPVVPRGCNGSTGIWRDGGGNNQSPFFITDAVARLTGLPADSLVAITTHNNSVFAFGIAKNWSSPMVRQQRPPRFQPVLGIHQHCGGYAESRTPDIWGEWVLSPPQCG